jgi:hypothetical protein
MNPVSRDGVIFQQSHSNRFETLADSGMDVLPRSAHSVSVHNSSDSMSTIAFAEEIANDQNELAQTTAIRDKHAEMACLRQPDLKCNDREDFMENI